MSKVVEEIRERWEGPVGTRFPADVQYRYEEVPRIDVQTLLAKLDELQVENDLLRSQLEVFNK